LDYAERPGSDLIDLHSHTNESDGTFTPAELVSEAKRIGLEALAITDHDTLAGFDTARECAREAALDLVCGIELSTKFRGRSVHLLGYFPNRDPAPEFREWLGVMQKSRYERNVRMAERLRSLGVDITLEEVRAKGRSLTGRPHFARVLMEKGYVSSMQQAFDEYLDESAKGYVERQEADFADAVERIRAAGGVSSVAHPIRLKTSDARLDETIAEMHDCGLNALEAYHSDHAASDVARYEHVAARNGLALTGGSDFHGANKPNIQLGTGANGNLHVPLAILAKLRELT
jgi:3',5'-nucleoside bisphosphate phosphatase